MSEARTVRVRIAVAVTPDGAWSAFGYSGYDEKGVKESVFIDDLPEGEQFHWIEADVPIPVATTIPGAVVPVET